MNEMVLELMKLGITTGITLFTLFLSWIIGQRIAAYWALKQKRKELQLSTANRFENIYGEFFSLWKLWNYYCESRNESTIPKDIYWDLFNRACKAEAGVEAIMVKISSECDLNEKDITVLAKFRQAFQTLRESISLEKPINWYSSEHIEYLTFKRTSTYIVNMLASKEYRSFPSPEQSRDALRKITSNDWENNWVDE